jgi:hypothetical protein
MVQNHFEKSACPPFRNGLLSHIYGFAPAGELHMKSSATFDGCGRAKMFFPGSMARRGQPPVQVAHGQLAEGTRVVNPLHLDEPRTAILVRRLREELTRQHLQNS